MKTIEVLARLTAHWPQLGGDDAQAEIRMEDWARIVERAHPESRAVVIELLVTGWTGDWPPKIADWQETARQVASRRAAEQETRKLMALEAGAPVGGTERVAGLLDELRVVLTNPNRLPAGKARPVSKYDPPRPIELGEKHMTPEEREAELAAFGDRKVRPKVQR